MKTNALRAAAAAACIVSLFGAGAALAADSRDLSVIARDSDATIEHQETLSRELALTKLRLQVAQTQAELRALEDAAAEDETADARKAEREEERANLQQEMARQRGEIERLRSGFESLRTDKADPLEAVGDLSVIRVSGLGNRFEARFYHDNAVVTATVGDEVAPGIVVAELTLRGARLLVEESSEQVFLPVITLEAARRRAEPQRAAPAPTPGVPAGFQPPMPTGSEGFGNPAFFGGFPPQ